MRWTVLMVLGVVGCSSPGQESLANPLLGPGSATHPAISPDGATVAFMSNMDGVRMDLPINFEIYLVDNAGESIRQLTTDDAFDADIAWSPDGRQIAFKSYRDENDEIYLMSLDGSPAENLTQHPASDFQADFSPDGRTLVFGSDRGGSGGLWLMDLESRSVEVFLDTEANESAPQWSPDGEWLAFVSDREGNDDVYVMRADGGALRRVSSDPESDWSPRWSPDGSSLVYITGSFSEDRWNLYRIDPFGDPTPELLIEGVDSGNADWDPAGTTIYFGRYIDGESRLFTADADGSDPRPFGH